MWVEPLQSPDALVRHPFWIFDWEEVVHPNVLVCSVVLFFSAVLCSAAGIGGGGMYVALLMVVGRLSPHNAVPLSKAIVFFGSVASLAANLRRLWSPRARLARSLIDLDALRVVVPGALIGTFLGVLLNWRTRDHVIVVLLTALLCFMTAMVLRTAWRQHCEEQDAADEVDPLERVPLMQEEPPVEPTVEASTICMGGRWCKAEATPLTCTDAAAAGLMMFLVVMGGILRFHMQACDAEQRSQGNAGSCKNPIIVNLFGGRLEFWMRDAVTAVVLQHTLTSLPLWSCVFMAMYYGRLVHQLSHWKLHVVLAYQFTAVGTGLLAGLVGVGGGLIFSPFFLIMGMEPAVAVATSSTCVFFTSSSTTIQYLFTDRIVMSLALVYGLITLLASWAGTSLVHFLQDRFKGKRSYITLVVALGVALSAALSLLKFVQLLTVAGKAL